MSDEGPLALPPDVVEALSAAAGAAEAFAALPASHQREYLEWIDEAVKPATRRQRIERTVAMVVKDPRRS